METSHSEGKSSKKFTSCCGTEMKYYWNLWPSTIHKLKISLTEHLKHPWIKSLKINEILTKVVFFHSADPWDLMRLSTLSSANPSVAYRESVGKVVSCPADTSFNLSNKTTTHPKPSPPLSLEMKRTIFNLSMNIWCTTCSFQLTTGKHLSHHKFTGQTCPCLAVNLTGGLKCENGWQTWPTKANSLAESDLNGL